MAKCRQEKHERLTEAFNGRQRDELANFVQESVAGREFRRIWGNWRAGDLRGGRRKPTFWNVRDRNLRKFIRKRTKVRFGRNFYGF